MYGDGWSEELAYSVVYKEVDDSFINGVLDTSQDTQMMRQLQYAMQTLGLSEVIMIKSSKILKASALVLYHGTLNKYVKRILKQGLKVTQGYGGANTSGVFLSKHPDIASYWAKMRWSLDNDQSMEAERFDRRFPDQSKAITVLKVTIPENQIQNLRADMEQAEDVGFEGEEGDWKLSLEVIGDVRFDGPIPASWVSVN